MNAVTILIVVQFVFTLVVLSLAVAAARHKNVPGRTPFVAMMVGLGIWMLCYGLLMALPSAQATVTLAEVQYMGIVMAPATWLLFCYEYTRQRHASSWMWLALSIMPVLTLAIVGLNPGGLFHESLQPIAFGEYTVIDAALGPLFWVHAVYSYLVILAGILLLVRAFLRAQKLYRQQIALLLVGSLVPWVGNAVTLAQNTRLDYTALLFGVTGLAVAWSFFRLRLLDVMPVARERVFESMEDAVFVLDAEATIVDINPAAERAFGIDAKRVIGRRMIEAFPEYLDDMLPFVDVRNTRDEVRVRERVFDLRISPLGNKAGRLIVLRDITERKKAEAEREALIKELNAYAHTVAHDLKTPLGVIRGYASIVKMQADDLPDRTERAIEAIHRNSTKLAAIVDDLLLLASVRGQAEIEREALDMGPIVQSALDRLHIILENSDVTLNMPDSWPSAYGHAGWVEEVWANYLSNAVKYGGKPPVISLGADDTHNGHVRFWVRDNGKGLTPEEQNQLFIEFSRLGEARAEGHGLGLSIVQRIITRLDGEVSVDSSPGEGSTFSFTLPTEGG